ncbi:MAG: hypothetical protein FJ404_00040 [Verrucomicrobia bacterium]|nr:hypothetical protein [Verrucomicrobiota bacterium]
MAGERLSWYWHRLRAMSAAEWKGHAAKKYAQWMDAWRGDPGPFPPGPRQPGSFPQLPDRARMPSTLLDSLSHDWPLLARGQWTAFGHLPLRVSIPPDWHKDYRVNASFESRRPAARLNHRQLPLGADIKLIWELSRWSPLVRLAQAAWALQDPIPAELVLRLLEDWLSKNPPYRGWNWTSALEAGIRLMQHAWIESLLEPLVPKHARRLENISGQFLPAHLAFVWRHRSFGSSANNHLLGELAGLIVALSARPGLASFAKPVDELQLLWEAEVLSQFAPDGGNREQALHYQLFSFELCWQTLLALQSAGRSIHPAVLERLGRAIDFFVTVQSESEPWDYGDSDSAWVTPLATREEEHVQTWMHWMNGVEADNPVKYWLGGPPAPSSSPACITLAPGRILFPDSGQLVWMDGGWMARWDLSELGYLSTAAHGHLDALHLSLWIESRAFVIDPGTGAYYGDRRLREYLASWRAHNGPTPVAGAEPRRRGPFLWGGKHDRPALDRTESNASHAILRLNQGWAERTVTRLVEGNGWQLDDNFTPAPGVADQPFTVFWQFAPGWKVEALHERMFRLTRDHLEVEVGLDAAWQKVEWFLPEPPEDLGSLPEDLGGFCSQKFREVRTGPALRLVARGHNPCLFRTTFLASRAS